MIRSVLDVVLAGLVTGYAIAVPVGAVAALILTVSAQTSWPLGACAGLGVATTDGIYAALAVVAGSAVAAALDPLAGTLRAASVAVLLLIAAATLAHALRPPAAPASGRIPPVAQWTPLRVWLSFVAITAVNPATVVYFAAIVVGGTVEISGATQGFLFVIAAFAASASWQILVASLGSGLRRWVSGPRGRRTTGIVAAMTIAALAVVPIL